MDSNYVEIIKALLICFHGDFVFLLISTCSFEASFYPLDLIELVSYKTEYKGTVTLNKTHFSRE